VNRSDPQIDRKIRFPWSRQATLSYFSFSPP
jgi:hypothetical protein